MLPWRHVRIVAALFVMNGAYVASTAYAEPEEDAQVSLRRALFDFTQGDYKASVARLEKLLDPVQLKTEDDVIEARKALGTMYFLLGEEPKARTQFELALLVRANTQLDLYATAPPVLRFFDDVKAEVAKKSEEIDRVFADRKARYEAPRYIERDRIKHVEVLCFLPFGIGQFQNGNIGMGILFLAVDLVGLGANILGYIMHALLDTDQNGLISPSRIGERNAWLGVQYAGLSTFLAGWIAGAVHARVFFEPVVTLERDRGTKTPGSAPSMSFGLRFGLSY